MKPIVRRSTTERPRIIRQTDNPPADIRESTIFLFKHKTVIVCTTCAREPLLFLYQVVPRIKGKATTVIAVFKPK